MVRRSGTGLDGESSGLFALAYNNIKINNGFVRRFSAMLFGQLLFIVGANLLRVRQNDPVITVSIIECGFERT